MPARCCGLARAAARHWGAGRRRRTAASHGRWRGAFASRTAARYCSLARTASRQQGHPFDGEGFCHALRPTRGLQEEKKKEEMEEEEKKISSSFSSISLSTGNKEEAYIIRE
jgi:uncharacterized protein involved in type VI secretion and phage assembly